MVQALNVPSGHLNPIREIFEGVKGDKMIQLNESKLSDSTIMSIGLDLGIYPFEDEGIKTYRQRVIECINPTALVRKERQKTYNIYTDSNPLTWIDGYSTTKYNMYDYYHEVYGDEL